MKLYLAVVLLSAVLVSMTEAQDLNTMLRLMGMDPVPLPPTLPKSLRAPSRPRRLTRAQLQQLQEMRARLLQKRRDEQETRILMRLQKMTPTQIKQLADNLTPQQLEELKARVRYLKQRQVEREQQKKTDTAGRERNTVDSLANRIRRLKDANQVQGSAQGASSTTRLPARMAAAAAAVAKARQGASHSSHRHNPLHTMHEIHEFHKKSHEALHYGCRYPFNMGAMETSMMYKSCQQRGAQASCVASTMSDGMPRRCTQMGISVMCCPPMYTSRVFDAINYMRKMENFMAQMS